MCIAGKLEKIDALFKLFDCHPNDDGIEFSFIVSQEKLNSLQDFNKEGCFELSFFTDGCWIELSELNSKIGKEAKVELSFQELKDKGFNVYWDWRHFLAKKPHLTSVPDSFLILSEHTIHFGEPTSIKVKHYFNVCEIVQMLISKADYTQNITSEIVGEVIFLHKGRLEIPIVYDEKVFEEGLDGISIVKALFNDESHTEQKTSILKEVIYGLLSNIPKNDRLKCLLYHFGEFSKGLNENYQLFVSEFSFDDVRKEYEERKREYFSKLNDVFSSVQTKMLGIPISIAIASVKMSSIIDSASFWTNLLLSLSIVIYSIIMFMLIKNQKHSLNSVKSDYEGQMTRLKHHYSDQYEQIKDIKKELDERYNYQNNCLNSFNAITACLFILILVLFTVNFPWSFMLDVAFSIYSRVIN